MQIHIYSKPNCPYCNFAKDFFNKKNWPYEEFDIAQDAQKREEMLEKSNGRKTVPQIFINGHHVGGYDDMMALNNADKLEELLK